MMKILNNNKSGYFSSVVGEYNPKIDYLFCKYLGFDKNTKELPSENIYRVAFDTFLYDGEEDAVRKMIVNHKLLIRLSSNYAFTLDIFMHIYKYFYQVEMPYNLRNFIEKLITEVKNTSNIIEKSKKELISMTEMAFDKSHKLQFIGFAHLLILIYAKHCPIILYPSFFNIEQSLFEDKIKLIDNLYFRSEAYNQKNNLKTTDEIIELIRKNFLKFREFNIKEIYLYGSFAENQQSIYSDLDLYIRCSKSAYISNDYINNLSYTIASFVGIKVDCKVDYLSDDFAAKLRNDMKKSLRLIFRTI